MLHWGQVSPALQPGCSRWSVFIFVVYRNHIFDIWQPLVTKGAAESVLLLRMMYGTALFLHFPMPVLESVHWIRIWLAAEHMIYHFVFMLLHRHERRAPKHLQTHSLLQQIQYYCVLKTLFIIFTIKFSIKLGLFSNNWRKYKEMESWVLQRKWWHLVTLHAIVTMFLPAVVSR